MLKPHTEAIVSHMSYDLEDRRKMFLGKEYTTNTCGNCTIVAYENTLNVTVAFDNPFYITSCSLGNLTKGAVFNPLQPTFFGKGYLGVGKYGTKDRRALCVWTGVLKRCYDKKYHDKHPTYEDVSVCKEWLDFQVFAEWFYSQKFSTSKDDKGKSYHLDKDILVKGNKVYSPETCCFVPQKLNKLFTLRQNHRGTCPIGVSYHKRLKKFQSYISCNGSRKHLGTFNTLEQAFLAYKEAKEIYVKEVANLWKDRIACNVYKAMINWEIELDD